MASYRFESQVSRLPPLRLTGTPRSVQSCYTYSMQDYCARQLEQQPGYEMPSRLLNSNQLTDVGSLMDFQAGGGEEQASRQDEGMRTRGGQGPEEDS